MTYKGKYKFGESSEVKLDDERYRFLAAVDSQAYGALCALSRSHAQFHHDHNFDADRAFDTYARINPEMEKTFHFASRYDGHIGNTSLANLDLFTDKFLKDRAVFSPRPWISSSKRTPDGELVCAAHDGHQRRIYRMQGIYGGGQSRFRNAQLGFVRNEKGKRRRSRVPLNAYENAKIVFAFAKRNTVAGFTFLPKSRSNAWKKSTKIYSLPVGFYTAV